MRLCNSHLNILFRHLRRTLRIINDKISGLDNFETLFPHTGQPRVIVFHIKLIMLTERLFITGRMSGDIISHQEVRSTKIITSL